jgi:hypothetical protein
MKTVRHCKLKQTNFLQIWFAASVTRFWSWPPVFISTSYTKSFVWSQKLKSRGVKWRIGDAIVLESVRTNLT